MQFSFLRRYRELRLIVCLAGSLAVTIGLSGFLPAFGQSGPGATRSASKTATRRLAKNVILFLGDAGGIPTLHAASLVHHQKPNGLFIQTLPHIGIMDTSAADVWVTDSAAGMSAIVTGQKTNNGVLSQSAASVRGKQDGERLKTILEYAEEHGLSTGVVSNVAITDATGAACFSHVSDRNRTAEIFSQLLSPAFGDGVDVIAGAGRQQILAAINPLGMDLEASLKAKGYTYCPTPGDIPADAKRVAALFDTMDYDQPAVVRRVIEILARNPKGFFLMVECDMHTDKLKLGLDHVLVMDQMVREAVERFKDDTLVLFTADHSFDIRVRSGRRGDDLLADTIDNGNKPGPKSPIRVDDGHSGEQVLTAAAGPGAERVHGFMANTDIFRIMMEAYGWKPDPPAKPPSARP